MIPDGTALWVYGSHARGEADEYSDMDVLAVVRSEAARSDVEGWVDCGPEGLQEAVCEEGRSRSCVSIYSWKELEGMTEYGSLFLHHLLMEARPLPESRSRADERLRSLLESTGPYLRARRDAHSFRRTIEDTARSIENGGSMSFELSVLATVVRHAAILACYLAGQPMFGRTSAVNAVTRLWQLEDFWPGEFAGLYRFRLAAADRCPAPEPPPRNYFFEWRRAANQFLDLLAKEAELYEKRLSESAA